MLIFDFDGVLLYSLDEIVITVYNAATGKRFTSLADLPQPLVGLFRRNRFHVQPIGDGILLMNWCLRTYHEAPERILQTREYEALIAAAAEPVAERTQRVYETRQLFIERDADGWAALHRPFQPLWNELTRRLNQYRFAILTNKNRYATEWLCRHFGLNIQTIDVYSGDKGTTKIENMRQIQRRYAARAYYFMDDSLKNLWELDQAFNRQKKVVVPLLAAWGYSGPEDQKLARRSGYEVLTQAGAIVLLSKLMPL